jgi:hypothetical protein
MSRQARLSRRSVLRGAGGVVLGLPFLPSLLPRAAQAQATPPRRLVLVSVGHSVAVSANPMANWKSTASAGALTKLSPILEPLEAYRNRMIQVLGVDNLVRLLVPSNGHNASSRTLLTCMPHKAALDGDGKLKASPPELDHASDAAGPSIEYVLADRLGGDPLVLRIGEADGEHFRNFRLDASRDLGRADPRVAFDALFGTQQAAPTLTRAERLARHRRSVLDAVRGSFDGLITQLGAEDRERFQAHQNHVREVEQRLGRITQIVCDSPQLVTPSGMPARGSNAMEDYRGLNEDVIAQAQNEMVAVALACQATRVVSLHYGTKDENQFPFLNGGQRLTPSDASWHGIVHRDAGTDEIRLTGMRWYSSMLADLLQRLEAVPDGEGTLLDNTTVVWISSLTDQYHETNNLPLLLAGAVPSPGRLLDYTGRPRSLGDLWATVLQMFGQPDTTFGWNTGTASAEGQAARALHAGVLTELL